MIYSKYPLKVLEEVEPFPPIQNTANPYLTESAMHADQANQLEGYGYFVDGVGAFTYLGTTAGTAADYEAFGGITGTGTANKLAKFTSSGAIGDSALTETAAGNIGISTTNPLSNLHVNGKASFGDSVTTGNAVRAYNMISTDAAVRILRVSPDISTSSPSIELMHRTTPDGVDTAYWDFFVDNSGAHIRNRIDLGNIKRLTVTDDGIITDKYKLKALNAAPATATSTGALGEIRYTADYIYVCTATNTWKRTALTTW